MTIHVMAAVMIQTTKIKDHKIERGRSKIRLRSTVQTWPSVAAEAAAARRNCKE